jgi:hypothetical protein
VIDGERALQGLAAVSGKGEHTLRDVVVEFEIDLRQSYGAADHIGLRLQREPLKAAAWQRLVSKPDQRTAQRR